jgi:thiamine transporter ThiT
MSLGKGVLYALIVGCEVGFWVALLAGLAARYLLKRERLSVFLLTCVPLIDLVLLLATVVDLRSGTAATFAHGLATAYIAYTVAFGSLAVGGADRWFAHRFAGGPPPAKAPAHGWGSVAYELKLWGRCLLAGCMIVALVIGVIALVDAPAKTQALELWLRIPFGTAAVWFVFGPLWSVVFFRREPSKEEVVLH